MPKPEITETTTTAGAAASSSPPPFPETAPGEIVTDLVLERVSLDELGGVLPASRKAYTFHRPNMGTMKRLGQLQADPELKRRPGLWVTFYLAAALQELDGQDMGPPVRDPKGANLVGQLPAGDVLTLLVAWTHAQHARQGVELGGAGCGACGASWASVRVNLGELEVLAVPAGYPGRPVARVGLWEGFALHGKEARALLVEPPTWAESLGALSKEAWENPAAMRAATVQGAIKAADVMPRLGRLGAEALDELMPDDLDLIDQALGRITASVVLELVVPCPECTAENVTVLPWKNLGFSGGPARV